MKKITTAIILIALTIAACTAKKSVVMTQTDADRAAAKFPGATLATLNDGKMLYEEHCGTCHGLKSPQSRNEAGWRDIVPPMADKANIDAKKEDLILQYLVTMASAK